MNGVHASHDEVEREEHLSVLLINWRQFGVLGGVFFDEIEVRSGHMMLNKLVVILNRLYS